jgi:hypothetical protein
MSRELHYPLLDLVFPRQGTAILLSFRRVICPKSIQAFPNITQKVVAAAISLSSANPRFFE